MKWSWLKKNKTAGEIARDTAVVVMDSNGPVTGRRVLKALLREVVNVLLNRAARKV